MDTTQFGYSQATVVDVNTRTIYIAGQIGAIEGDGNDFESQVDRAFDNLLAVLQEAGGRAEDIVKITVLIKDHDADRLAYVVKKRREVFGEHPPASTLVPVTALALDSLEFEIDAVAVTRR
jgi:enamine deaminase RidA (YjgF/YER057c/UK114 family)